MFRFLRFWILCAASGVAVAGWEVAVDAPDLGVVVYSDYGSAVRKGDEIKMWSLIDFAAPQTGPTGKSYRSQKLQIGYTCEGMESKLLYLIHYPEQMGEGDASYQAATIEEEWRPIVPDSLRARIFEQACEKVVARRDEPML